MLFRNLLEMTRLTDSLQMIPISVSSDSSIILLFLILKLIFKKHLRDNLSPYVPWGALGLENQPLFVVPSTQDIYLALARTEKALAPAR